jgi:hypothetical protein
MSDKYKELYEKYPEFVKDRFGGFAIGDGWFDIVDVLCFCITNHITSHNEQVTSALEKIQSGLDIAQEYMPEELIMKAYPTINQVKEKFGGLRFYVSGGDPIIWAYIRFAEYMASKTCEECGAPGTRHNTGWIRTLCATHATVK